jgi:hypothetical protein
MTIRSGSHDGTTGGPTGTIVAVATNDLCKPQGDDQVPARSSSPLCWWSTPDQRRELGEEGIQRIQILRDQNLTPGVAADPVRVGRDTL